MPLFPKGLDYMATDIASATGYEYLHGIRTSSWVVVNALRHGRHNRLIAHHAYREGKIISSVIILRPHLFRMFSQGPATSTPNGRANNLALCG
jgi:hypothetical protein